MKNIIWLMDDTADFFKGLEDGKVNEFHEASRAIRRLMNASDTMMQFSIGGYVPKMFFEELGRCLEEVKGDAD